jgi:5-methyltetrahydropteroyltriglutamate--homocysteine methyltransferase
MADRTSPPFRADHVGSLLRPPELHAARADFAAGQIGAAQLRAVEDEAITAAVAMQDRVGLRSATDGEFRRATWHMDFIYQIGGISQAPGNLAVKFHNAQGDIEWTPAAIRVDSKIVMDKTIFADDFRYLQSVAGTATAKLTIPSPNMVHYRGGPAAIDPAVYPDVAEFWADLAAAYAAEVAALAKLGCRYLQFDDTSLAYLNDPAQRAAIAARGEDAEHLHLRYIKQVNDALAGRPAGMAVTTHLCRGNFRSSWAASGGYDFVAEALFGELAWTGSSWSMTMSGRAPSGRCGSSRPARWWSWAWSPPSAARWRTPTTSSGGSTRPPASCPWTSCACPRSAASPPPSRGTRSAVTSRRPSST